MKIVVVVVNAVGYGRPSFNYSKQKLIAYRTASSEAELTYSYSSRLALTEDYGNGG